MKWVYGVLTATYLAMVAWQAPTWHTNLYVNGAVILAASWAHYKRYIQTRHYVLINLTLIIHNIGAFGMYEHTLAGIYYDKYVHALFSAITTYTLIEIITERTNISTPAVVVSAMAFTLAIGAGWELIEYTGKWMGDTGALQPGEGALYTDTILDLAVTLAVAVLTAIGVTAIKKQ